MNHTISKYFILTIAACLTASLCLAQPGGGGPGGGAEPVPISGIEWLLLAGGMFGFRKIYQNYKDNKRP